MPRAPFLLCILDGFGLNPNSRGNAVAIAKKPTFDRIYGSSPSTTLTTFGEAVGLPAGQMGNSEVGHLNIGAGRVVEQWLLRISRALAGDYLDQSPIFKTFSAELPSAPRLHICGLFSDGGVHSHAQHLELLLKNVRSRYEGPIHLHLITDGRDTSPHSGAAQVTQLEELLHNVPRTYISSIIGRFFAMDRDKRWDRTQKAYNLFVKGEGAPCHSAAEWLTTSYAQGITDEFIEPARVSGGESLQRDDAIIFFNFREDRMRQMVGALCLPERGEIQRFIPPLRAPRVLCFTEYDHSFCLPFLFPQLEINNHLGEVLSLNGRTQLRTAETEKYPHVTYFLNGGIEKEYAGETRKLIPSPRDVKTYDLKPEMSAIPVTAGVCEALTQRRYDVVVVNIANCDMVGHTGVLEAAVKAVETADSCLGKMVKALDEVGGTALILADHGNAEQMINYEDGTPFTSHTKFPVPCIVYGAGAQGALRAGGALCDVAPTVLQLLGIAAPAEMTGRSLLIR